MVQSLSESKRCAGAIEGLADEETDEETRAKLRADLEDLFLVVQLYSYPGDYVAEKPSIERMAETLDKLEEDVLERFSAKVPRPKAINCRVWKADCRRTNKEPASGDGAVDRSVRKRCAGSDRPHWQFFSRGFRCHFRRVCHTQHVAWRQVSSLSGGLGSLRY